MRPRLIGGLILLLLCSIAAAHGQRPGDAAEPPVLTLYLEGDNRSPSSFRALRHLEARTEHFGASAWMDVWTEADESGFRYRVAGEGGSGSIRTKVFRALLAREQNAWDADQWALAEISPANYIFDDHAVPADGLARLGITARRKDVLLVNGTIVLDPDDGNLVRVEGLLSKTPSFWIRQVRISRRYERISGVRMPVSVESAADVILFGRSSFTMSYRYDAVNGRRADAGRVHAAVSEP
ncbi:MAG: hypothetical protein IT176_08190 [Acidobacteria bacterium]|nr:hypothetical protein [Acidobacteriota bacterium]